MASAAGHDRGRRRPPALRVGLDTSEWERLLARVAWHEWAHALSVVRASEDDITAGTRLLEMAPPGLSAIVRRGGHGAREYTHELVAETFALLMARRRRGPIGQPEWLADEIYALLMGVVGWNL